MLDYELQHIQRYCPEVSKDTIKAVIGAIGAMVQNCSESKAILESFPLSAGMNQGSLGPIMDQINGMKANAKIVRQVDGTIDIYPIDGGIIGAIPTYGDAGPWAG